MSRKQPSKHELIRSAIWRRSRGSRLDQSWYDAHKDRFPSGKPMLPPNKSLLLYAQNEYFTAGAIWERKDGQWSCTKTAPILNWMRGLNPLDAKFELLKRGCSWQFLTGANSSPGELDPDSATVGKSQASPTGQT